MFAGRNQEVALLEVLTLSREKLVHEEQSSNAKGWGSICFGCRQAGLEQTWRPAVTTVWMRTGLVQSPDIKYTEMPVVFMNVCSGKSLFYVSGPWSLHL